MRYATRIVLAAGVMGGLMGCQSAPAPGSSGAKTRRPVAVPAAAAGQVAPPPVIAIVDGQSVPLASLQSLLIEAAGVEVLGELVLDRRLAKAMADRRLTLTEQDIDRERQLLLDELAADRNEATRLLEQLREQRGWGTHRYDLLLRRNAGLRTLIEAESDVPESAVRQAYEQRYGPKQVVRLILVPSLQQAGVVRRRLEAGESFTDVAVAMSQDVSRAQGGLLPPISRHDDTYPKAIRDVVAALQPGQVSSPVSLEDGFAILQVERTIEAENVPFDTVAERLRRQVRLRYQRTLMERQARVLMQDADVTVLDAALNEAWKRRQSELVQPQ